MNVLSWLDHREGAIGEKLNSEGKKHDENAGNPDDMDGIGCPPNGT
jgi:hypothetical protein